MPLKNRSETNTAMAAAVLAVALTVLGVSRADPLSAALERNSLCAEAGITQLIFEGVEGVPSKRNFCAEAPETLPSLVIETIQTVSRVHHGEAALLDSTVERTFGLGFTIQVIANDQGPLISQASGDGMIVGAFPDWKPSDFPAMVYAHELVHVLTFNGGPFSTPVAGLRLHPFLIEALPDLIAAAVNSSTFLSLGDGSLPSCLNNLRDETPPKAMNMPLEHFLNGSSGAQLARCCDSLTPAERVGHTRLICDQISMGRRRSTFTLEERAAPFEPSKCFSTANGITLFDKCDTHQFGHPLTSFFFSLESVLGRPLVKEFLQEIRGQTENAMTYQCQYAHPGDSNPKSVVLKTRNVLPLFTALREKMNASDQASFDRVWSEHAMEKLAELDRLYSPIAPKAEANRELAEKNSGFAIANRCMDIQRMDARTCEIACTAL